MSEFKEGYRNYEIEKFRNKAREYLDQDPQERKSMKDLCEHLNITRQTLCKYKRRSVEWHNLIIGIRGELLAHNNLIRFKEKMYDTFNKVEKRAKKQSEMSRSQLDFYKSLDHSVGYLYRKRF